MRLIFFLVCSLVSVSITGDVVSAADLSSQIIKLKQNLSPASPAFKPAITVVKPNDSAPGNTITIYGSNLSSPDDYLGPVVVFIDVVSSHVRAKVVSDHEIQIKVPPGAGTDSVYVDTAHGKSDTFSFTFLRPEITMVSPEHGGIGQLVTISGKNFGRPSLPRDIVKFGNSVVHAISWDDNKIVVKAPSDFGTGTNINLILDFAACFGGEVANRALSVIDVKQSGPNCDKLIPDAFNKLYMTLNPNLFEKEVPVSVQTSAGWANSKFIYRVLFQTAN